MQERENSRVAHFNLAFFAASEAFIYHYVSNHKRYSAACIASSFLNNEEFPFAPEDKLLFSLRKYTPRWILYSISRKYFGHDLYLADLFEESGCSIVHAHFGINGARAVCAKKQLGIPLVTSFYGYDISGRAFLHEHKRDYAKLFGDGDLFLALGPLMEERLINAGCPPHKIKIQRISLPLERIPFRPRRPKQAGEKVNLIFAGRFVEKKGLIYALQALRQVSQVRDDFIFNVLGDGPLRESVAAYVREQGLDKHVRFFGFIPNSKCLREMERADIFILPSVTAGNGDSEGTPTTIIEAQASGLPVISTYHSDIPYIVVPGKSALLSEERDVKALAGNILHLLENQHEWEAMGTEGRRLVERNHDIEKEVAVLENRYDELL